MSELCKTCSKTQQVIKRSPYWVCTVKNKRIEQIPDSICLDYIESPRAYWERQKKNKIEEKTDKFGCILDADFILDIVRIVKDKYKAEVSAAINAPVKNDGLTGGSARLYDLVSYNLRTINKNCPKRTIEYCKKYADEFYVGLPEMLAWLLHEIKKWKEAAV